MSINDAYKSFDVITDIYTAIVWLILYSTKNTAKAVVVKSTSFIHIPNKYQYHELVLSITAIIKNSNHGCQKLYTISTRRCVLSNFWPVGVY